MHCVVSSGTAVQKSTVCALLPSTASQIAARRSFLVFWSQPLSMRSSRTDSTVFRCLLGWRHNPCEGTLLLFAVITALVRTAPYSIVMSRFPLLVLTANSFEISIALWAVFIVAALGLCTLALSRVLFRVLSSLCSLRLLLSLRLLMRFNRLYCVDVLRISNITHVLHVQHSLHGLLAHHGLHAPKRTVLGLSFGNCQRFVAMVSMVSVVGW